MIVDSSLWLDGEKQAWHTDKSEWDVKLSLSEGLHTIVVQAVDDMGLESSAHYYIQVNP